MKFSNTHFSHPTNFSNSIFNNTVCFLGNNFTEDAIFDEVIFSKEADFSHVIFKGKISFKEAVCKEKVNFFTNNSRNKTSVDSESFWEEVDFSGITFYSDVRFTNRKFRAKTNFTDCTFHIAPDFHGCTLHQDTIFPPEKNFKDITSPGADQAYRTLGLAMAQFKARRDEAKFYALEQKSLRRTEKFSCWDKFLSFLYEKVTDYGQSVGRILFWLVLIWLISFLTYAYLYSPTISIFYAIDMEIIKKSLKLTAQQIVRPFSLFNLESLDKKPYSGWFLFVTFMQSLLTLSGIALTLLTIRWKFKRE